MAACEFDIVTRASRGDRDAAEELYNMHFPRVYRIALAYSRHYDDAADIAQETFIKAFEKLDTLSKPESFGAWISQIARTTALNKINWRKARHESYPTKEEAIDLFLYAPENDTDAMVEREREIVRRVIADIPREDFRRTVEMFYTGDGMTVERIARKLKVEVSTVTTRLNRFRSRYRKEIMKRILELREEE